MRPWLQPLSITALLAFNPAGAAPPVAAAEPHIRATIVPGTPAIVPPVAASAVKPGDIALNFPAAAPEVVARAVLGDILGLPYTVSPQAVAPVTLVAPSPVPRGAVFALFEDALKAAGLAVTQAGGVFTVRPLDQARGQGGLVAPGTPGYASETVQLQYVGAEEMRKLLEPVLPGVASRAEGANALLLTGTSGQRSSARDLLRQFDVNWLRNMSFALYVPQRTDARIIVPELDKLLNAADAPTRGQVKLLAMERLNGILAISGQRQYLDDVQRWVEILDREGQNNEARLFVYRVQNGRSKDLAKVLNGAFGNPTTSADSSTRDDFALEGDRGGDTGAYGRGIDPAAAGRPPPAPAPAVAAGNAAINNPAAASPSAMRAIISSDETNNAVIVFGTPRDYAVIEDALRKLDVLPYQVLIEAAITEVTLNNNLRYGVQWNFQAGQTNFALSDVASGAVARAFPGFSFFFSNNNSISATLNALEEQTKVNVLSAPKLMVLNNQTAALQVGDQVPVATQSAVSVTQPGAPIVNSIEYRDTGVILKVTPRVNGGGLVLLDIAQEVSDVNRTTSSSLNSPTISTRRISTSIAVQDGQVIALGGLIRDTRTLGKTGLPLLSRIPLIGGLLFGRTDDSDVRTELLVLLKPRVVRTIDDARAVTDELRAKIKALQPSLGQVP